MESDAAIQHPQIFFSWGGHAPKPASNAPAGKLFFQIDDHTLLSL